MIEKIVDYNFLEACFTETCNEYSLSYQDLKVKTLLHLPRFNKSELNQNDTLKKEVLRIAKKIKHTQSKYKSNINIEYQNKKLERFEIRISNDFEIKLFIGKLHYLESIRKNSIHLTLYNLEDDVPVGITSISKFDLFHLDTFGIEYDNIKIISRFYSLNNMPRNLNSYFMGLIFKWVKNNLKDTEFLITYLNRNVGFSGTNYKASNWKTFAFELNTRYNYYKDNYVTDRFLVDKFGSSKLENLKDKKDVSFSKIPLMPLEIFYYNLTKRKMNYEIQNINIIRK